MGFDHLFVADHVLGADPKFHSHPSLATYSHEAVVHEALTLMAYLAAITRRLTLATGILILPQRQTALVAKQAAQIDVLSGGRLRLGIGVGWNAVEFEALNETFDNRGRRSAEQIAVLRALWTQPVVDFRGEFHRISHAGLNPMPIQRPIPIWFGVGSREQPVPPDAALRRIARLADGWSPNFAPDDQGRALVDRVHQYAREADRDPARCRSRGGSAWPVRALKGGPSRWRPGGRSGRPRSSPSRGTPGCAFPTDTSTCCADSRTRSRRHHDRASSCRSSPTTSDPGAISVPCVLSDSRKSTT